MTECDILIIGAGPVGTLSALLLAKQGRRVIIIDREPAIINSPRAIVYLPQSLGSLKAAGILDDVCAAGLVMKTGVGWRHVSDHKLVAHIDPFALHADDNPQPAILLGQHLLINIIAKHLQNYGVEIRYNHTFQNLRQENNKVIVMANDTEFTSSFVIGADGSRSAVRKALGIEFEGFTHPLNFMAVNFRYAKIKTTGFNEAQFIMDPQEKVEDANFAVILQTGSGDVWRCAYGDADKFSDEELKALPHTTRLHGLVQSLSGLASSYARRDIYGEQQRYNSGKLSQQREQQARNADGSNDHTGRNAIAVTGQNDNDDLYRKIAQGEYTHGK
ncbi:hypothetical protein H2198_010638 [Neophaeococcomyces mojaviensis]|uniref:Uncharacterized protein n=1 Tax=Neophaeococcomyces mojaviensis TaxID=3383035 RepID=A0ACC2ZR10_9EURO|nr:hypothetical protein H2198_010638 [Knufia sp. JES_112]